MAVVAMDNQFRGAFAEGLRGWDERCQRKQKFGPEDKQQSAHYKKMAKSMVDQISKRFHQYSEDYRLGGAEVHGGQPTGSAAHSRLQTLRDELNRKKNEEAHLRADCERRMQYASDEALRLVTSGALKASCPRLEGEVMIGLPQTRGDHLRQELKLVAAIHSASDSLAAQAAQEGENNRLIGEQLNRAPNAIEQELLSQTCGGGATFEPQSEEDRRLMAELRQNNITNRHLDEHVGASSY